MFLFSINYKGIVYIWGIIDTKNLFFDEKMSIFIKYQNKS